MPTINGSLSPILVSTSTSYDPSRGLVRVTKYSSAGNGLDGMMADCIANRIPFECSASGVHSEITITESDGVAADTWQLMANENQIDLKQHPRVVAIASARKKLIYEQSQLHLSGEGEDSKIVYGYTEGDTFIPGFVGDELLLYNLLIREVSHYSVGSYVLKHTANIPNIYGFGVGSLADVGVERIYTTDQLVTEITNDVAWTNPCSGRILNKVQHIERQEEDTDDLLWGWRKLPVQETIAANNRVDVSYEYWLAAWPRLLFAPYES